MQRVKIKVDTNGSLTYPDSWTKFTNLEIDLTSGWAYADYSGTRTWADMSTTDTADSYKPASPNGGSQVVPGPTNTGGSTGTVTPTEIINTVNTAITNNQINMLKASDVVSIVNNNIQSGAIDIENTDFVDVVNVTEKVVVHNKNKPVGIIECYDATGLRVSASIAITSNSAFKVEFSGAFTGRIYYAF